MENIDGHLIREIDNIMNLPDDERAERWGELLDRLGFELEDFD